MLSDAEKRKAYDAGGKEGLNRGGYQPPNMADILRQFCPGFMGGNGGRNPNKAEDVIASYEMTLEELCLGKVAWINFCRDVVCVDCKGTGCPDGRPAEICKQCNGAGEQTAIRQNGPFIQSCRSQCAACQGLGHTSEARCPSCRGRRTVVRSERRSIPLPLGADDCTMNFARGGNEFPGKEPGDLLVKLRTKQHPVFYRGGQGGLDLVIQREIDLVDALTGVGIRVKHPDGRDLFLRTAPGAVVRPGQGLALAGAGLPGPEGKKGNLMVVLSIKFPTGKLADNQMMLLRAALPKTMPRDSESGAQSAYLQEAPSTAHTGTPPQSGGVPPNGFFGGPHAQATNVECKQQ